MHVINAVTDSITVIKRIINVISRLAYLSKVDSVTAIPCPSGYLTLTLTCASTNRRRDITLRAKDPAPFSKK